MVSELSLEKKLLIEKLLESESMMVHVRADQEQCVLPAHLKKSRTVSIKLSHYFSRPLFVDEQGIKIELSFDNLFFNCEIPFNAIWACTSFEGLHKFWTEDLPEDLVKIMEDVQKREPDKILPVAKSNIARLPMTAIKNNAPQNLKTSKESKPRASHLKLVKK